MTTIYLLRHGEITQRIPRRYIGQSELDLTPTGRQQIESAAEYLRQFPIQGFYCSPLRRCIESCSILCSHFPGSRPQPVKGLEEISLGYWEGLSVDEVKEKYPGSFEARGNDLAGYRPEGGESFADVKKRAWQAFTTITEKGLEHMALVAHAGVNRTIISTILGMELDNLFKLEQDYGCLNILRLAKNDYRLISLNIRPHYQA